MHRCSSSKQGTTRARRILLSWWMLQVIHSWWVQRVLAECKRRGRAGRAGRRLRPLFNGSAAAQRPVVIPSWRATPVLLLWPRVSYSPAVSPNLYFASPEAFHLPMLRLTSQQHICKYLVIASIPSAAKWTVKLLLAQPSQDRPGLHKLYEITQLRAIALRLPIEGSGYNDANHISPGKYRGLFSCAGEID